MNDIPDFSIGAPGASGDKKPANPASRTIPSGPKIPKKFLKSGAVALVLILIGFAGAMWHSGQESRLLKKLQGMQAEASAAAVKGDLKKYTELQAEYQIVMEENQDLLETYARKNMDADRGKSSGEEKRKEKKEKPTSADLIWPTIEGWRQSTPLERLNWRRETEKRISEMSWWNRQKAKRQLSKFDKEVEAEAPEKPEKPIAEKTTFTPLPAPAAQAKIEEPPQAQARKMVTLPWPTPEEWAAMPEVRRGEWEMKRRFEILALSPENQTEARAARDEWQKRIAGAAKPKATAQPQPQIETDKDRAYLSNIENILKGMQQ